MAKNKWSTCKQAKTIQTQKIKDKGEISTKRESYMKYMVLIKWYAVIEEWLDTNGYLKEFEK